MKSTLLLLITFVSLLFAACQADQKTNTRPPVPVPPASQPLNTPVATTGVQHYICPKNCAGSGSSQQGACPVCGSQYVHNAAYHTQTTNTTTNPTTAPSPIITNPPATMQTQDVQAPQTQEPAQNAAGVWHYVCSKGCAGGSGERGFCSKCNAGLVHNAAYHQ